ncbi:Fic family protein (plasmid) [Deinococcus psychrotolerans]|uniref:Fic family protein n=1 Tax=Deinococcus psychrotolerans TaxID=2489213 RepID=A0A3G8YMD3_9DEIO|nr:Fic family protein [Deinococcus psychrotolerans]AZI45357.1 Fic family protein [Deinococcus psychrotolerans]
MPPRRYATGQLALHTELGLNVPEPYQQSWVSTGTTRKIEQGVSSAQHTYPKSYRHGGTLLDHLRFALRYEPLDLRLLSAAFRTWGAEEIRLWVQQEPTGERSRRAWFLYEALTGQTLELPDTTSGAYVGALNERWEYVAARRNSPRHRVTDNLLGTAAFSVTVRRTDRLEQSWRSALDQRARQLLRQYDPALLARAITFLYTTETLSSFQIEREQPDKARERRFVQALRNARKFNPLDPAALRTLQQQIVEGQTPLEGWRTDQVFVGETVGQGQEQVHFVTPQPADLPALMDGWQAMTARLLSDPSVDPVLAAAAISFAFVFIHPFPDGNGRLHRYLIHQVLEKRDFTPPEGIFPISASMLRDRRGYDDALESFSRPLMEHLDFELDPRELTLTVRGKTAHLYRHFDATTLVEYLYGRIEDTIARDLSGELDWLSRFDQIFQVAYAQDLPDVQAKKLVRYLMEQRGRLSNNKRPQFADIAPEKLRLIEERARQVFAENDE